MDEIPNDPRERALLYLGGKHRIKDELGSGTDGIVFSTTESSVIKVHATQHRFNNELQVYLRLRAFDVDHIGQFSIPRLRHYDKQLWLVEMSHVRPPFLLDFGKARLDTVEDFGDEAWDMWYEQVKEKFGEDFETAIQIYHQLVRKYGIYQVDLSPYNLRFRD